MGFRFRKSVKLMPGVRLNVSKSGISTSIGGRGATVNFSNRGIRTTVGIPGTGLSYTSSSSSRSRRRSSPSSTSYYAAPSASSGSGSGEALEVGFIILVLGLLALIIAITTATELENKGNLIAFLCSVVFIALLIFIGLRRIIKFNKEYDEQIAKRAEEAKKAEEETALAYAKRAELVKARYAQKLLSESNYTDLLKHIADRSMHLDSIDRELARTKAFYGRINYLNEKYGELADKIYQQQFWIGMTREQLIDSIGRKADKVETEVMKTKTKETLIYGNKTSGNIFVFENGFLARFKKR